MYSFSKAYDTFGLKIRISTTLNMCREPAIQSNIILKEEHLKIVEISRYLGFKINKGLDLSKEIPNRISRIAATYSKLRKSVWDNRKLDSGIKVAVESACILPTLLCYAETWTTYAYRLKRLQSFPTCLVKEVS